MPKSFLIAGHTQGKGEGAQNLQSKETENQIARSLLLQAFPEIQKEVFTDLCPFDLSLEEKIAWVNKKAGVDDVVISCHLDSSSKRQEKGAMCYYYGGSKASKNKAQKLLDEYCEKTGLKNNGVRPDTASRFQRLGIIRDTKGWAFLLELGSINNDLEVVKERGSKSLLSGIKAVLEIKKTEDEPFSDVSKKHPYFSAAHWAKKQGVAKGYGDCRLGIDETLSVGRFLAFLKNYDQSEKIKDS